MPKTVIIPDDIAQSSDVYVYSNRAFYLLIANAPPDNYNAHYSTNDPRWLKILVYIIFIFELVQSGLMANDAYLIFGAGYGELFPHLWRNNPCSEIFIGDLSVLAVNHTDWFSVCILGSVVAECTGMVQGYYAFRLWNFTKSNLVLGVLASIRWLNHHQLTTIQVITGIIQGVKSHVIPFSELQKDPRNLGVWIISAAICDIFIAGFMVYYLRRTKTGFVRTDRVIAQLVGFAIETGLITAIMAILLVVLFMAVEGRDYFEISAKGLAKVYSNQLMVVLNSRERVKASLSWDEYNSFASRIDAISGPPQIRTSSNRAEIELDLKADGTAPRSPRRGEGEGVIHITTSTSVWKDNI
ncbi:hypothetical protein DL96DRAFT_1552004 [Flagelloscypha sp. PMI_526]|nr:hypothetical protein DL96DRAFT_1552004 [Flagelloscypha sp. PMI_526]